MTLEEFTRVRDTLLDAVEGEDTYDPASIHRVVNLITEAFRSLITED